MELSYHWPVLCVTTTGTTMKSLSLLNLALVLACVLSLSSLPSYADWRDARRESNRAAEDSRDANEAQHRANQSARKGHGLTARLHSRHAANERRRAAKHRRKAQQKRWQR